MASETPSSFIENLINSRNRDISLFLPFLLGINPENPIQETENQDGPRGQPDRIILINPFTQGMVVIERGSSNSSNTSFSGFDSLFNDLFSSKGGQPPASKASIDALETVEIGEKDDDQCVICLEEWGVGDKVKQMPCKHRFHGECIEKWLKIHGSCPVCRYEMPVDEKGRSGDGDGESRREIWVSFTFSRERRSGESNQDEGSDSLTNDQEMQR